MTYEEISKYPPKTIIELGEDIRTEKGYWYTEKDKEIITQRHDWVELSFFDNNTYSGNFNYKSQYVVEGWLFDGEEWHIVSDSWDGWQIDDFKEILRQEKDYKKWKKNITSF